jgi:MoxR-like ATPase
VFADVVLADEINRAPAKTQSALLEAMEERQVTVDNVTYPMSNDFIVFATQNPLEFEGTYALPEAQLDRFMVRIVMEYPTEEEESAILTVLSTNRDACEGLPAAADPAACDAARKCAELVVVDQRVVAYVRGLVRASRGMEEILLGSSPRAGQMLIRLAKAYAAVNGMDFVTPDHIRELAPYVLPHRWVLKPAAEIQGEPASALLAALFDMVKVPQ